MRKALIIPAMGAILLLGGLGATASATASPAPAGASDSSIKEIATRAYGPYSTKEKCEVDREWVGGLTQPCFIGAPVELPNAKEGWWFRKYNV